ncbi:MAG TPA: MFS transporter [Pirellulales bacterium]
MLPGIPQQSSAALNSTEPPAEPPSRARYGVLAFLGTLTFILYLDRVCISQAVIPIQRDLNLSGGQMGWVLGAFTVAYGLFEVPTGSWGDRFGSRGVLTRIVLWWSAFTMLTGASIGLTMMVVVRFLFGAGEAGAYPNAARVVTRWFPIEARARAQGLVIGAAQLGGMLAPPVAEYLISLVGWRWSFVIFGALGIVWSALFYAWFRDDPARHPAVNEAECALIGAHQRAAPGAQQHPPIPWRLVFSSRNVWLLGIIQTCCAFVAYLFMTWYPTYLQRARGASSVEASWLSALALGGGAAGCLFGGVVNDWLVRITGSPRFSYRLYGVGCLTAAAAAMLASVACDSPRLATAWCAAAYFAILSGQAAWWPTISEISGPHVGAMFGLMNSLGVPGAFASSALLGAFADYLGRLGFVGRGQWDPAFYIYAAALGLAAVCWLGVDADRSIA